ncbi:MAG: hypothetical protein GXY83_40945 [Rhodopirellula sp.]|nr:hypothetical protein [Rhodopirellula sp.]
MCLAICPMAGGVHNPRPKNDDLFSPTRSDGAVFNEHIGWHLRCVVGWRKDDALRRTCASGGLATWCLETLLETNAVTRVASVRLAQKHDKGMFEFFAASSVKELRASAGSIYQPIEISGILREIARDKTQRWAIVGVPCLCAGIRNLKHLREQIPYVLGLACGMYQNIFYTEMLLAKSGVDGKNARRIEFRRKSDDGPPSDFRFRGTDNRGPGKEVPYRGLPYYLGKHAFFRLNACNFCKDVFAETADACFMDAWLPEYVADPKGASLVVIRDERLEDVFQSAQAARELFLEDIAAERLVQSQRSHVKRKQTSIHFRNSSHTNEDAPRYVAMRERLDWWLQQRTQQRSKQAWARFGRPYGRLAFWAAMLDLVAAQLLLVQGPSRFTAFSRKAVSKVVRWLDS